MHKILFNIKCGEAMGEISIRNCVIWIIQFTFWSCNPRPIVIAPCFGSWPPQILRIPYEKIFLIPQNCLAIVGQVSNVRVNQKGFGRSRSNYWLCKHMVIGEILGTPKRNFHFRLRWESTFLSIRTMCYGVLSGRGDNWGFQQYDLSVSYFKVGKRSNKWC